MMKIEIFFIIGCWVKLFIVGEIEYVFDVVFYLLVYGEFFV